jgi:hypothetical protein
MTTTPTADPCRQCGTTGGFIRRDMRRPWRARGYCMACYSHLRNRGIIETDMPRRLYPSHEYMLTHAPNGDRHVNSLPFADEYDPLAVRAEAERFAANWLADHPAYVAKWCADEARAA